MSQSLLALLAVSVLIVWCLWVFRELLRAWVGADEPPVPKRKCSSRRCPFPTKRPGCPLCQAEEEASCQEAASSPEPPPAMHSRLGRKRSVETAYHFCPYEDCDYYGWLGLGNLISNGHPNGKTRQLYCKACRSYFTVTLGTPYYRRKTDLETIQRSQRCFAEGLGPQQVARVFDVKPDTAQAWQVAAAAQAEAFSDYHLQDVVVEQVQMDEMWVRMGQRQEETPDERQVRWLWAAMASETKLWLEFLIADRSQEAAQALVHRVCQRLAEGCVPLFLTDGYKPYAIALLTHFGHWVSQVSETGRKLRDRWFPLEDLDYAQVVKHRRRKRLVSVTRRVIYGSMESVQEKLQASIGTVINTAFIERLNLTLRQHVPALARKALTLAKTDVGLERELNLRRAYHNFCLPHRSLRQRLPGSTQSSGSPKIWQQRTPAIAAGITDRVWTLEQVLMFRAPPWRQSMPQSLAT